MAVKKIVIKGNPPQFEAKAEAAFTPGMLLQLCATSGNVKKHATSGGNAAAMFAIEDSLQGSGIGDDYAINTRAQYVHAQPGDEIYAWLAVDENVAITDFLESNGAGLLKKHTPLDAAQSAAGSIYTKAIVAQPLEALDLSGTSADVNTRIKVRIV